jgi:2-polyprenyl-6-hydroxyphenyl methylase/3-demethylubiquinone-9 3-methyltransferase
MSENILERYLSLTVRRSMEMEKNMPVDNDLYNDPSITWWNENEFLYIIHECINPVRFGYFEKVMKEDLNAVLTGKRVLDVGCGGGFLSEEFARAGSHVSGIDPSGHSIEIAKAHASQMGLPIEYLVAAGERIPFDDASFDIVCCCDVLEHVDDFNEVIAESVRVLKGDGVYFYDTINRTLLTKLIFIKLSQEWKSTRMAPRGLHDWSMFIKPKELYESLLRNGIEQKQTRGLSPGLNPIQSFIALRKINLGRMTCGQFGRQNKLKLNDNTSAHYLGYGIKSKNPHSSDS